MTFLIALREGLRLGRVTGAEVVLILTRQQGKS
jgi:hypothetical protein